MSFFCVYDGFEHPEEERTLEHIVPYSIGGPGALGTRDVSKAANNTIGSTADGLMTGSMFIGPERFRLKLKSENGNIPPFSLKGTTEVDGHQIKIEYVVEHNGTKRLIGPPTIETDPATGHGTIIATNMEEAQKIIDKKAVRANRDGTNPPVIQDVKNVQIQAPLIRAQWTIGVKDLYPAFAKMALGIGHYALGYAWSREEEANRLRMALRETEPNRLADMLSDRAQVFPEYAPPIEYSVGPFNVGNDKHLLILHNETELVFECALFGKFWGWVRLSDQRWSGEGLDEGGTVFIVDCESRSFERVPLRDFKLRG